MPDRKVLKDIKPFNKFLFRSCYYHQLMAAYARFGVDEQILLKSFLPVYKFDETDGILSIDEVAVLSETDLERITGIHLIKKCWSDNLTDEIVKTVDRGIPMLLACDSYEMPWRKAVYRNTRIIHWLLIYGYDKRKKTVIVSENDHNGSAQYTELEFPVADLERMAESFRSRLLKPDFFGLVKVKRVSKPSMEPVPNYGALIEPLATETRRSADALERFLTYFAEASVREGFNEKGEELRTVLLSIRPKKEAQRYQISALYEDNKVCGAAERIMQAIIFLCGVLYKLKITGKCPNETKVKMRERMAEWLDCERWLCGFFANGGEPQ
jgi:hypothetical protein